MLGGADETLIQAHFVEEEVPDFGAAGAVEGGQAEGDVHAGLEGLVEGADAVGCEEEDAVEVFEGAEEDWVCWLAFKYLRHYSKRGGVRLKMNGIEMVGCGGGRI